VAVAAGYRVSGFVQWCFADAGCRRRAGQGRGSHPPDDGNTGGRVIDTAGDGILTEFGSIVNAVECAIAIQTTTGERQVEGPRQIQFRIGVNQGDVIHDEARIYGDWVNVAARLESIAEPGGIRISAKVHDERRLKNRLLPIVHPSC